MMNILRLVLLLSPAGVVAFVLELRKQLLPKWPTPDRFIPSVAGDWWHWAKNALAEIVRADCFWWGTFFVTAFWLSMIGWLV